jgi:hypothetical protein
MQRSDSQEFLMRSPCNSYKELTSFANYPYRDRMMEPTREADWEFMQTLLPKGFRELASEMGLIRKRPDHIG